jgi:hypothetical protein
MAFPDVHDSENSTSTEGSDRAQQTPTRLRSLTEIYEETEPVGYFGMCMIGVEEPSNFDEAVKEENWKVAMKEEIDSIKGN